MESVDGRHIDSLIGKPFQIGGRGPHAYDCLGVVLECVRVHSGEELPDPREEPVIENLKELWRSFLRLPSLGVAGAGDVLFLKAGDGDQNVAYIERPGTVVTANAALDVHRARVEDFERRYPRIDALRLKSKWLR